MDFLQIAPATLLSFALASFLIELTPGPNMTYLALVSAGDGRNAGFATVVGIALGLAVIGMVAALGVAELIQASDMLYEGLRWAGVLFLLYLAWEGWTAGTDVVSSADISHGKYFTRGLVTNLLNPKAAVFYVAVLPTFVEQDRPILMQTLVLSAVYVVVATIVHAYYRVAYRDTGAVPQRSAARADCPPRTFVASCGCGVMVRLVDSALG